MELELILATLRDCFTKNSLSFDHTKDLIDHGEDSDGNLHIVIRHPLNTSSDRRFALEDAIRDELKKMHKNGAVYITGVDDNLKKEHESILSEGEEKIERDKFPNRKRVEGVKRIFLVTSAKGGVGKSTVAMNLAIALSQRGHNVGLLDLDVYGPSVPTMTGTTMPPMIADSLILPIQAHGLNVMSMGFLIDKGQPLIWRGPMLSGVINQMLHEVDWRGVDYLVIDMPPGTGDTYLTTLQELEIDAAIAVTTPSQLALDDTLRGIEMFKTYGVEVAGLVENMATYCWEGFEESCRLIEELSNHCQQPGLPLLDKLRELIMETKQLPIFGSTAKSFCAEHKLRLLSSLPIDVGLRSRGDTGEPYMLNARNAVVRNAFSELALKLETLYPIYEF